MKLFILKLLSLLVLCLGLISLAYYIGFAPVTSYLAQFPDQLAAWQEQLPEQAEFLEGVLDPKILWLIGSIAAIVLGVYGFFPRFSKWKKPKRITYDGPHGQVQIQLDTVEHSLNSVLSRMPEVKKIDVTVEPRDSGRSALIRASAVLQHQPGQNARAIAGLVSDYIAETATKMLGLEELATIELNVTGINVNSRKSSKQIRQESLSHSGNAPVELLEANPKRMSLSAPGGPLGSGPIEEEMEEDEGDSDSAYEASAVDSKEEESKQAAARSELLEPLDLHGSGADAAEKAHESAAAAPGDDTGAGSGPERQTPDIADHSRPGSDANASVVPEPLGNVDDGADDDEVLAAEDDAEEDAEVQGDDAASLGQADVEVPDELPEAVEMAEVAKAVENAEDAEEEQRADDSRWAPDTAEDTAETPLDTPGEAAEDDEEARSESESEGIAFEWEKQFEEDAGDTEGPGAPESDLPESDRPNLTDSESTDSIIGDLDEASGDDEESAKERGAAEEKKSWGWFN